MFLFDWKKCCKLYDIAQKKCDKLYVIGKKIVTKQEQNRSRTGAENLCRSMIQHL